MQFFWSPEASWSGFFDSDPDPEVLWYLTTYFSWWSKHQMARFKTMKLTGLIYWSDINEGLSGECDVKSVDSSLEETFHSIRVVELQKHSRCTMALQKAVSSTSKTVFRWGRWTQLRQDLTLCISTGHFSLLLKINIHFSPHESATITQSYDTDVSVRGREMVPGRKREKIKSHRSFFYCLWLPWLLSGTHRV